MEIEPTAVLLLCVGIILFDSLRKLSRKLRRRKSRSLLRRVPERPVFDPATARAPITDTFLEGRAHIIDGDSLVINGTQVRLFGVDAPEINHPFGRQAKWALISMCRRQVITAKVVETDKFGRTVAKCSLKDGRDLSAEMVKLGLAIDWAKFSGGVYRSLEVPDARRKLWLADARQKGRMHLWDKFEARQQSRGDG